MRPRSIRFRLPPGAGEPPPIGQIATGGRDVSRSASDDPTTALHALTGWALERAVHASRISRSSQPSWRMSTSSSRAARRSAYERRLGLALRQVGYTNKSFWRNPASAFFTFAFPLMFLVIFTSLLGGGD